MTEIQQYLAEEVAEDLADGIITRREAMRRLGLLGADRRGGDRAADQRSRSARPPWPRRKRGGKDGTETALGARRP